MSRRRRGGIIGTIGCIGGPTTAITIIAITASPLLTLLVRGQLEPPLELSRDLQLT